jgi:serine/threonine protein kinase
MSRLPIRAPAGQFIGVYKIARPLGKGGMGEVFLALDPRLDRHIALKLLTRQYTADAWRVRRFQQEARLASALNHPNILVVHELGEFEGRQFIATEYVEGRRLRAETADGRMAPARALDIATQAAGGLNEVRRRLNKVQCHLLFPGAHSALLVGRTPWSAAGPLAGSSVVASI